MLDALIGALTTRAAQLGMTREPETDHQRKLAALEGWIHVPKPGTLSLLGGSKTVTGRLARAGGQGSDPT